MTPRQFYKTRSHEEVQAVCQRAGTSFANFKQIALSGGAVGSRLARRLEEASDRAMGLREILFPADYE